jgi:hypothetical protein
MDSRVFGKVDLAPTPGTAKFPDSLSGRRTDVLCHAFMIGLAFALYLAHTLFGRRFETAVNSGGGGLLWR